MLLFILIKVTCRVQKWKKKIMKIVASLVTVLLKMTSCLCITKKALSKSI